MVFLVRALNFLFRNIEVLNKKIGEMNIILWAEEPFGVRCQEFVGLSTAPAWSRR
jgi:hypothetical protein